MNTGILFLILDSQGKEKNSEGKKLLQQCSPDLLVIKTFGNVVPTVVCWSWFKLPCASQLLNI